MAVPKAVRTALKNLPAVLVLEADTWIAEPNSFAGDFLFYFRALAFAAPSNDGSGGSGRRVGGRTAAELESALVAPEPISVENERAALTAAATFLKIARAGIDVLDGSKGIDEVDGCTLGTRSMAQRMRADELAAVDSAIEFVGDYEAGFEAHIAQQSGGAE